MALNLQIQTYQILPNDDQMLILCLSYSITTVSIALDTVVKFRYSEKATKTYENLTIYLTLLGTLVKKADSGPLGYVLWCCGIRIQDFFTFIQIGSGHTVLCLQF